MLLYIAFLIGGLLLAALFFLLTAPVSYSIQFSWDTAEDTRAGASLRVGALMGTVRLSARAVLDLATDNLLTVSQHLVILGRERPSISRERAAQAHHVKKVRKATGQPAHREDETVEASWWIRLMKKLVALVLWPARAARTLGRVAPLVSPTLQLVRSVFQHTRPDYATLVGVYSLGDPFATSQLQAVLFTANVLAHFSEWSFHPNYVVAENWGQGQLGGQVRVVAVVYYIVRYLMNGHVRRELLQAWARSRARRRAPRKEKPTVQTTSDTSSETGQQRVSA